MHLPDEPFLFCSIKKNQEIFFYIEICGYTCNIITNDTNPACVNNHNYVTCGNSILLLFSIIEPQRVLFVDFKMYYY
ncbi:hypothetical protein AGMMS49574_20170 [Bacteroidia bacterium]|nr:hypothetical protein AGMMS49574_20170 [Bacteroidia bacterium]